MRLPIFFNAPLTTLFLFPQQAAVSITQEPVVVLQGMVVYLAPVVAYKGGYQQQQCALRLVEIRNQCLHNFEQVSRCNKYLGARDYLLRLLLVKIVE